MYKLCQILGFVFKIYDMFESYYANYLGFSLLYHKLPLLQNIYFLH
jgi:hypothetical protein